MNLSCPLSRNDYSPCHRTPIADVDAAYPVFCRSCRTDCSNIPVAEAFLIVLGDPEMTPEIRRIFVDDASSCRPSCTFCRSRHSETAGTT